MSYTNKFAINYYNLKINIRVNFKIRYVKKFKLIFLFNNYFKILKNILKL